MKKRIFSLVLALSCMAVLSACGEEETAETEESSTAVEIATVERGSISSESNVSGQVVSDGQESVSVALSVRCTDVYVEVGDTVSAGQAICKLDISATMANYETASMSYDNAKKSYAEQSSLLSQQRMSLILRRSLIWGQPPRRSWTAQSCPWKMPRPV